MRRTQRNVSKRIVRSPRPAPTFGYSEVESALAEVFDAGDAQRGIFRARLQNFRKLGIPATNPGKGQRLRYALADILQLLLALELTEYGLDPALAVKTIRSDWARRSESGFFTALQYATQSPPLPQDVFVVMNLNVLSASFGPRAIVQTDEGLSLRSEPNPITVRFTLGNADFTQLLQERGVRLSVFNLSDRIRAIKKALAI
jgi:hypothetical protein